MYYTGVQIGTVLANLLGGIILQYVPGSWEAVFYIFGSASVVWFLLWCVLCYNDPNSHPFISEKEKLYLKETIGETERKKVISQYKIFELNLALVIFMIKCNYRVSITICC